MIRIIDMFGGLGGFRLGIERAVGKENVKTVAYYDIDRHAVKSYNAIHEESFQAADVTKLLPEEVPEHDIICAGFPCQAFSQAGHKLGFADPRGNLFFEIMRIAVAKKTPYLFLENVKGLLSHDNGKTFETILKTLDECGYDAQWEVLNSKNFGVPQNRERIFIIANLRGVSRPEVFPLGKKAGELSKEQIQILRRNGTQRLWRVRDSYGTRRNLLGSRRIRKLTPREYWRLQGFFDCAFDKARAVNSDAQLYKQAGNSVTVNVIEAIAEKWLK